MLHDDIIQPSSSPWSSPVTLVPKPDGSTRFCVDYRQLNKVTWKDRYPLPLIQDIFDQVGGSSIFTTLDLKAGYWQIPVAEKDIPKTAFVCHKGLYEFKRLPFGLANAPSQFQRIMDKVLAGLIGVCVLVYIDDLVIYSKDQRSHANDLKLVFERLRKAGLKVKPSKCCFAQPEVKLLGYIINKDGIRSNPEKVTAIQKLSPPKDVKGVRSFLGMCNYYAQTLPSYAQVAEPLYKLTRKNQPFVWGPEQQKSFETLKELLGSNSVMAYPQINQPYKLYTDACGYAIGGILVQEDENGIERVIQYVSHQLSGSQLRWATIEKEAYSVVYCINKLRPYLWGAEFTVYTDHKPLKCLFTQEMRNTKIQRWGVLLAEFGAKIEYIQGKKNIRVGILSQIQSGSAEVGSIDTGEWVDPDAFQDDDALQRIPLEADEGGAKVEGCEV